MDSRNNSAMQQLVIIDGKRYVLTVKRIQLDRRLFDVSAVGDAWKQWAVSGQSRMEIEATTEDGAEVKGVFRILSQTGDGAFVIEPWSDNPVMGDGE